MNIVLRLYNNKKRTLRDLSFKIFSNNYQLEQVGFLVDVALINCLSIKAVVGLIFIKINRFFVSYP
jgi:hypothetical protein